MLVDETKAKMISYDNNVLFIEFGVYRSEQGLDALFLANYASDSH
jgi:hypothetical protein